MARIDDGLAFILRYENVAWYENGMVRILDRRIYPEKTCYVECINHGAVDGHVVNKIGTFQIALAAHYWGIPYFVTGMPDAGHPGIDSVKIEERDSDFVLSAMGKRTAMQGVKGCYPAFDITPPHLVGAVVTDRGIFSPYNLKNYFAKP